MDVAVHAHSEDFALLGGWYAAWVATCPSKQTGLACWRPMRGIPHVPASEAGQWIKTPWRSDMGLSDAVSAADTVGSTVCSLPARSQLRWLRHDRRAKTASANTISTVWRGAGISFTKAKRWKTVLKPMPLICVPVVRCGVCANRDDVLLILKCHFRMVPTVCRTWCNSMQPSNDPAPDAVWRAAYRWLARWKLSDNACCGEGGHRVHRS